MRVDFLVAGVQGGGTTTLDAYLRQHPSICMANRKEIHFFDADELFRAPRPNYPLYHAQFTPRWNARYGESTPIYVYWPEAPRRIWQYNAAMRLIVLLRCPLQRAWSHWRLQRSAGTEALDFSEAIRQERARSRTALPAPHREYSYTDRGFYSEQIRRLHRFFPDEQLLFLRSERFFAEPQSHLDRVCNFLGVERRRFDPIEPQRQGERLGPMPPADRDYLRELFRPDDGEIVATVLANRYRADLDRAGLADGRCAFSVTMPASAERLSQVSVRRAADGTAVTVPAGTSVTV